MTTSYSYDYYLRNVYSANRFARKSGNRETLSKRDLVKADSSALDKITRQMRELEYSSDNGANVLNHAKLFVQTYNNTLESTDSSDSEQIARLRKQMKNLTKEQKEALEDIGISIGASGKLSLDKKEFAECSPSKIKSVLGEDSPLMTKLSSMSKNIKRTIQRTSVPTQPKAKKVAADTPADTIIENSLLNDINPATAIDVLR